MNKSTSACPQAPYYRNYQSDCRVKSGDNNAGACGAETSALIECRRFSDVHDWMWPSIVITVSLLSAHIKDEAESFSKRGVDCNI